MITGKDLIEWGIPQGRETIEFANKLLGDGISFANVKGLMRQFEAPKTETLQSQDPSVVPIHWNISPTDDVMNLEKVQGHINELARVPTIRAISIMPDACPCGNALGTIPVGGVAVAEGAIHPGMHSADICCSVAITVFRDDVDGRKVLDAGMNLSHFGPGGRKSADEMTTLPALLAKFEANPFLRGGSEMAKKHYGTQGDGNHFFSVGRLESTGEVALVTHHGSRGPGAELYKKGMRAAKKYTAEVSPSTPSHNAWLSSDSREGEEYWQALQLIREWTKGNHFVIHDAVVKEMSLRIRDRYWNEHNFVFRRGVDFVHAKGATPNYAGFSFDSTGKTLIPLNMGAPILVAEVEGDPRFGTDLENDKSLGFCPHGAGRHMSRTQFGRELEEGAPKRMIADVLEKLDVRAWSGKHDISEFPLAYKSPESIVAAIEKYKLTRVVDKIQPIGCIMAGHVHRGVRD